MRRSALSLPLFVLVVAVLAAAPAAAQESAAMSAKSPIQERADRFLEQLNSSYQALRAISGDAEWKAATDVSPEHDAAAAAADKAQAAVLGNPALIRECRALLEHESELDPLTVRELRMALLNAAEAPMTNPELVAARIDAETKQASTLNGFEFKLDGQPITVNAIDDKLRDLTDVGQRLAVWEASKQSGPALKPGLVELQGLRNKVARELGYPDYFTLQVARHDMTTPDMLKLQESFLETLKPLYEQIYTWAKYELAKKYHQPVPDRIPAHWVPNRWSQEWEAMVSVPGLDAAFAGKTPEWIVQTGERFYTSMGRPPLPESFWKNSDLYPVPAGSTRKKNTHASCWHIDLENDIRSLQSVEANEEWFGTVHHELGHAYYDMAYTRPEVPMLLRTGASPAFHEGFATIGELAARQWPYLESLGLVKKGAKHDDMQTLLRDALATVPFMFWASGTVTHWEADMYAKELPADQWNSKWWEYVEKYQGIVPPAPRGEEFCDAATKTHINDTPAYYFSYAIASVISYQLHDHIARAILKQDPHRCIYAGNKQVGAFLEEMEKKGATEDWRKILKDATGEDLSTRAMVEYFKPLMSWLQKQNKGRKIGWEGKQTAGL